VITLDEVIRCARSLRLHDLAVELADRRRRRSLPHKFERVGYVPIRNPDADDGLWKIAQRRQTVYARRELSVADQIGAARRL